MKTFMGGDNYANMLSELKKIEPSKVLVLDSTGDGYYNPKYDFNRFHSPVEIVDMLFEAHKSGALSKYECIGLHMNITASFAAVFKEIEEKIDKEVYCTIA